MKKLVLVVALLLFTSTAYATLVFDWIPDPTSGGSGFITVTPFGAGATDSDFTSSTIIDFQFTFDNWAPIVTLSDLDLRVIWSGIAGRLAGGAFWQNATVFTDARLVFAGGSADYKTFLTGSPSIPYPQEINSGN